MNKIKVSADTVLSIFKNIINDEDINYTITDPSAPREWKNKKVQDILNVDYYTFRHKPMDTETFVRGLVEQCQQPDTLLSLSRAFCVLSLETSERVFSKDLDVVTIEASLEYWIQSDKVKILEDMFEDISVATNGIRIPIQVGNESRSLVAVFSHPNVTDLEETTEFGEMSVCEVTVDFVFYPKVKSRCDYTVECLNAAGNWDKIPFSGLGFSSNMTQKSIPLMNKVRNVGNVNLSRVKTITLVFDGYETDFIDDLVADTMASDVSLGGETLSQSDNNKSTYLRITRGDQAFTYHCIVKDHVINVQEDGGNEVHTLTLTTRGITYGTT